MTFNEFYSEIVSSMKQYDSANLIDKVSVYNWVIDALRKFGNLPTIQIEKVIEVNNRKASLPDGFKSLRLALKCEPYDYECDIEDEPILQSMNFYKVISTQNKTWNHCEPCCIEKTDSCIVEKTYLKNGNKAKFYYKDPQWLKLTSFIKRDICTKGCPNLGIKNAKYEISINKKTIYTNFSKGSIYIIYNGFEEDDDGFIEIPETEKGYLKSYVEYYIKRRIIEDILGNSDNTTNETALYQLYQNQELLNFANAKTEMKFKNINLSLNKYKNHIKKEFEIYNFGNHNRNLFRRGIDLII